MAASSSPTVLKRWLAFELRRLREGAGRSRAQAAARLDRTVGHITHLETGRSLPSAGDLELLLGEYGAADRIEQFRDLVRQARKGRDWWRGYSDVVRPAFELYLGLEASASRIEQFSYEVVPGLLQTPEYAEAVLRGGDPGASDVEVARRLEMRMSRKAVLDRADPPHVWAVLDECMLRRQIGGRDVLRAQLLTLIDEAQRPHVDLQVLPAAKAAYGVNGGFTWFAFPPELGDDPGIVHAETVHPVYYEDPEDVARYRATLTRLHAEAAGPDESIVSLGRLVEELM